MKSTNQRQKKIQVLGGGLKDPPEELTWRSVMKTKKFGKRYQAVWQD